MNKNLSPRQQNILYFVANGYKNHQIAQTMNIAERTVEYHLIQVFYKLDVHTRASAVYRAMKEGIIK